MGTSTIRSSLYRESPRDHGYEPLQVEGALPEGLAGTLVRNGPGEFAPFGRLYGHLFEGQGALTAVRFGGGRAEGAHRLIESPGFREERAAGRPLYGSLASRPRRIANALRRRDKNAANVNVLAWQGRLFGLRDLARPIEVSRETLATIGETDLEGVVPDGFSAHPHAVAARGAVYGFAVRFGRDTLLDLVELPACGRPRRLGSVPIPATVIHDFAATERHLVFFLGPARIAVLRALLGDARPERLVRWDPAAPGEVVAVPIDEPGRAVRFPVDPFFVWHYANAFERGGELVVDYVRHPDASAIATLRAEAVRDGAVVGMDLGELHRATLDLRAGHCRSERVAAAPCEFPRVDSRGEGGARRYVWLTATERGHLSIARVDLETGATRTWTPPAGHHVSEAIFAPHPGGAGETDGFALVLVYDEASDASHVAVLDARAPEDGPVARAYFAHHVPLTLHGTFVPA
jgi:all-trans-8'-apo-beta-carotenal 15,15'-oxygenase